MIHAVAGKEGERRNCSTETWPPAYRPSLALSDDGSGVTTQGDRSMRLPHLHLPNRRADLGEEIDACIREGTGLRQEQWLWTEAAIARDDLVSLSEAMVDWCL